MLRVADRVCRRSLRPSMRWPCNPTVAIRASSSTCRRAFRSRCSRSRIRIASSSISTHSRPRSGVNVGDTPVSGNDVTGIRGGPRDDDGYRIVIDVADRLQPNAYMIASPTSGGDRLVVELRGGAPDADSRPTAAAEGGASKTTASRCPGCCNAHDTEAKAGAAKRARPKGRCAISSSRSTPVTADRIPGAIGVGKVQEKRVALAIAKELRAAVQQCVGLSRRADAQRRLLPHVATAHDRRAQSARRSVRVDSRGRVLRARCARRLGVHVVGQGRDQRNGALARRKGKRVGPDRRCRRRQPRRQGRAARARVARSVDGRAIVRPASKRDPRCSTR